MSQLPLRKPVLKNVNQRLQKRETFLLDTPIGTIKVTPKVQKFKALGSTQNHFLITLHIYIALSFVNSNLFFQM